MAAANGTDRLRLSEKICFGVCPIGKNMCAGVVYGSFLSLYFMQTLGISPAFLSVMFFLCRIWDGLIYDLYLGIVEFIERTEGLEEDYDYLWHRGLAHYKHCTIVYGE